MAVPAIPTNFMPRPTAINGQGSLCLTTVNEKLDAVNSNSAKSASNELLFAIS